MSEIKLLPCPFCGGEAEMEEDYSYWHGLLFSYKPHCSKCGCNIGMFSDKTEAIEKWNTRKPMERIIERLEEKIELHKKQSIDERLETSEQFVQVRQKNCFVNALKIVKEEGGIE